jgi:hypothetical protein
MAARYHVAEFIDPWGGDKVDSGIWPGGPVRQLYAGVDFILQVRVYEFGYWAPAMYSERADKNFQLTRKQHN